MEELLPLLYSFFTETDNEKRRNIELKLSQAGIFHYYNILVRTRKNIKFVTASSNFPSPS